MIAAVVILSECVVAPTETAMVMVCVTMMTATRITLIGTEQPRRSEAMAVHQYARSIGKRFTYKISYDRGKYFIARDGYLKKAVPDAIVANVAPGEAMASLMLRMAIADIESLIGMNE